MLTWRHRAWTLILSLIVAAHGSAQDQKGTIRGVVYDKDFEAPLALAQVLVVETGQEADGTEQGNYSIPDVAPGKYTLVFSKEGYVRQVRSDVVVSAGRLTDVDAWLSGQFTDMPEFIVQDSLALSGSSEAVLLELRFESASFMDSIGADLMSKAGASDAASALTLVSGATVQEGKFAVIRGLPDRYVSSQMNGVRLPTADEDKRAVELDQFPSTVIESIQVSKTFTPDQQGDASGGAVDVRLRGIPDESVFQFKSQVGYNSNVRRRSDFLTYEGGGVSVFGHDDGSRDIQYDQLGSNWDGAVGVSRDRAPVDYKLSMGLGGSTDLDDGLRLGGFASLFYERDSSYHDDGKNDSYWVEDAGGKLVPETIQGSSTGGDFKTALFDIEQGTQEVKWGGLGTVGLESEHHDVSLTYLYTHSAEDTATLAIDTRGKQHFFPGYDPNDPTGTGNAPDELAIAPYIRTETLEYTERTTETMQLRGRHDIDVGWEGGGAFENPRLEWRASKSSALLDQPDKRQFGALWLPESFHPGQGPFLPPYTSPETWLPFKPAALFTIGNLQRIWKRIEEKSDQYAVDLELPFVNDDESKGSLKFGLFEDHTRRTYNQDTFSNFNETGLNYQGGFDEPWSQVFGLENHPVTASQTDVDYRGDQQISAWYGMFDVPLDDDLQLIGGARVERTALEIRNDPEADATWFPPGATSPVALDPGDPAADASFERRDVLPAVGLVYQASDSVTLRTSYSETVARQTFKELTPILQSEFLGGPIFIGNPDLTMSSLKNYDVRADWVPYEKGLFSVSWFRKDIEDPIEYVQRFADFTFTTPVNYPSGQLTGYEFETRHDLGHFTESLEGLGVGANATLIDSVVDLPQSEIDAFNDPGVATPIEHRDMTGAPEHLYNLYCTFDVPATGTAFSLFYTVKGDTLVAGANVANGNFVPNIYAKEYGTLNFGVSQELSERTKLEFQAKNLTNPRIEEVYRSDFTGGDVTHTSYTRGREFSIALSGRF
ncbi:MAG: TonB-dependent receptor [Planctomycetes bacterium]|nr:TonB-dependent receptor [Planctomycetota bacterium]